MADVYYTSVVKYGNNILLRSIENGQRVKRKVAYSPTLYIKSKKTTEWKTLDGEFLEPIKFDDLNEASTFVRKYEDVSNFKVYGNASFAYAYIAEEFPGIVEWDMEKLHISILDIEVSSENGFPDPYKAQEPITAITVTKLNGGSVSFGCGPYKVKKDEIYIQCKDEADLCEKFLLHWEVHYPDVVTGWYSDGFDIPYLVNRIFNLMGEADVKRLSPWGVVKEKRVFQRLTGKELITYEIFGISNLDYKKLYMNFAKDGKTQESYTLNAIANFELKEGKTSYEEYDNLHQLYKKNHDLFIEYNIKDTTLIKRLDEKLKLMEMALTLAYDSKSNYEDVFAQTRMWDAMIHNYLIERKIVVPPKSIGEKNEAFEGAYVKEVQVGMHEYPASFDLDSLYPHLQMMYNISPETLIEPKDYTDEMRRIISDGVSLEKLLDRQINLDNLVDATMTPNGQFFRTDVRGFLPQMLDGMYSDRKKYKKLMLETEQLYENETDEIKKSELAKLAARYNNLQLAKKVGLNSSYGAMGSKYFRFYDIRLALAITLAGQLSIKWIEGKLNSYMNKLLKTDTDYVIASDTDSIYLRLGELVHKVYPTLPNVEKIISFMDKVCTEKIQPFINDSFLELSVYTRAYAQKMRMKREALCDKGIWTAKKRYVLNVYNNEGVQYHEPHLKVKGLEMVKSSTPMVVRKKMEQLLKIIMNKTEKDVQKFVADFREDFSKLPAEDVSFPRSCNGLKEYSDSVTMYKKGTPIHVKGAIVYNHYMKAKKIDKKYPLIQEGEKLKYTYLKLPNPMKSPVLSFPAFIPKELGISGYIDYQEQFQKTFIDPITVILNCIGWSAEKKSNLMGFYK